MRIQTLLVVVLCLGIALPASSAEQPFKDVPKDHWAAEYVAKAAADGIVKGYPDSTFKGDKAVTRYELAVALERMIEVVEKGLKPEVKGAESGGQRAESTAAPSPQPSPLGEGVVGGTPSALGKPQQIAPLKGDPAGNLKAGGYIATDSPLLKNTNKTVTPNELAQALASVADRLIQKTIPPPEE